MHNPPLPPYKAMREAIGLSQRAVERELGWNTGRLSTIERGLLPTDAERFALLAFLNARLTAELAGEAVS
jgi:transcriptional regulator with XRE-family HTH domain